MWDGSGNRPSILRSFTKMWDDSGKRPSILRSFTKMWDDSGKRPSILRSFTKLIHHVGVNDMLRFICNSNDLPRQMFRFLAYSLGMKFKKALQELDFFLKGLNWYCV
ncbi:UNVERIFIED_CONTAM: hypothetical protein Sindi_0486400 [Sesamum indicum]